MGIVREPGENVILVHGEAALDNVKPHVSGVDQTLPVRLLDIVAQFGSVKIGAKGDKRIPDV